MPEDDATAGLAERPGGVWWHTDERLVRVRTSAVRAIGVAAHEAVGASTAAAGYLTDMFLDKAIKGDHARGHLDQWLSLREQVDRGDLCVDPEVKVLRETAGTALVDDVPGGRALLGRAAMDLAIAKARTTGIACVALRAPATLLNLPVEQAVAAGMVGVVMTQTYPLVAPLGGRGPLLGNAPMAIGIPAGRHEPVILDLSVTETSSSGVKLAAAQGQQVAEGMILDERGMPTTDARDFPAAGHLTHASQQARGSLVPLGGGHKGYALVFAVGLLASILSDTDFPWEADEIANGLPRDPDQHYGSFYLAIDAGAFAPLDHLRDRVDEYIDAVKASPTREGVDEILYPGERSQQLLRRRNETDEFLLPESQCVAMEELGRRVGSDAVVRVGAGCG